jgi:hypothetical protein
MDKFSYFFAFYGLILGLAVAEVLGGVARFVRARAVNSIGAQTGLLAALIFIVLCATWIDSFSRFQGISLDLSGLWAPILTATCYFLAATVIFPSEAVSETNLDAYYQTRKRFVLAMLLIAECGNNVSFLEVYTGALRNDPARFWGFLLPYNLLINSAWIGLMFAKSRRANITLLAFQIFLFTSVYWSSRLVTDMLARMFGP